MSLRKVEKLLSVNNHFEAIEECFRNALYSLGKLLGDKYKRPTNHFRLLHSNLIKYSYNTKREYEINEEISEEISEEIGENISFSKEKTIKVKLCCNWTSSRDLALLWNKMSQGNFRWNRIQIVWNDEIPDHYVIINRPLINDFPALSKSILFQMEPNMKKQPFRWGEWSNPNNERFEKVCLHNYTHNNCEWHISKTYQQLKSENIALLKDKSLEKTLSTVLSSKYSNEGHVLRVDFIKYIEKKMTVHVFGDNKFNYMNYKGSLPYHCKDKALLPYKYTFNVENNSIKNYFTEKIIDGILSECLVFYSGCFNLREYLPVDSFVYLELADFEHDFKVIQNSISNNLWEKRLPAIRKAKHIILDKLQFFPRVERIILELENERRKEKTGTISLN